MYSTAVDRSVVLLCRNYDQDDNKLGRQARLFRKVQIDSNRYKEHLAVIIVVLFAYLTIWTAVECRGNVTTSKKSKGRSRCIILASLGGRRPWFERLCLA